MRKKNSEGGFSDRVTVELRRQGVFVRKFQSSHFSSGMPDLIVITQGITAFVELKREGKDLSPLQSATMRSIARAGGLAICLRVNPQEGCDVSYMDRDGILHAISTCTIRDLPKALHMTHWMRKNEFSPA